MTIDNLMFASINLPVLDKVSATKEILALDHSLSFWDDYRFTQMFPLMTRTGEAGRTGTSNAVQGEFKWVSYAPRIITDWFDTVIFPWIGTKSRIMALVTQPGVANLEHIDCNKNELNTRQHKFRIVLQGDTSTLYFITKEGNIRPPNIDSAFLMDGGWPHGMVNTASEPKVTLAFGAPWIGKEHYDDGDLVHHLFRNMHSMPDDLTRYWNAN